MAKRTITQAGASLFQNAYLYGFFKGGIYTGGTKNICVPGLNCYSCPGALFACPLGSLQNSYGHSFPYFVVGLIALFGAMLGRAVCGFLCPFGFVQDLLYKIKSPKIKKGRATKYLSYLKYIVLAVFVIILPLYYLSEQGIPVPAFCKWICPSGTLFAGIPLAIANSDIRSILGLLFGWKTALLVALLSLGIFIYRPFCRFLCPLGAIYSFFNPIAVLGIKVDESKCTSCGRCVRYCKSDVSKINSRECIRCGDCKKVCPTGAICTSILPRKKEKAQSKTS